MVVALFCLLLIIAYTHKSDAFVRINIGMAIFIVGLLVVPIMDVVYIKGQTGLYSGFYVTVAAVGLSGLGDALVQGGVIGSAGEMPERYMQAVVAGTAASGVLVSFLRIFTKAVFSQDTQGLRRSAILYFSVSIVVMAVCIVFYNVAHRLPVIKYYRNLKAQAVNEEKEEKGCAFQGPQGLNAKIAISACIARLLFYPLFLVCLHGPEFFRTEIPVTVLTCLLGLTNGYLTSVLMILAPKAVQLQHAETAGIVIVLFLVVGLAIGSIVAWFWVI
ncbi:unnamed protein product, partial [Vitis vinifera]